MNEVLDEALRLAEQGVPVFPCVPNGKRPLTAHGFKDASTDPSQIREWWTKTPTANLAIPTGKPAWDVLDMDIRSSGSGEKSLNALRDAGYLAGALKIVLTPSGGKHYYFKGTVQGNGVIPNHHIDFRGMGGYVVVPPSHVIDKEKGYEGSYRVLAEYIVSDDEWIDWRECVSFLTPPVKVKEFRTYLGDGNFTGVLNWLRSQPEGNRNNALYWAGCRIAEKGGDVEALREVGLQAGLNAIEVKATIESAKKRGAR